MKHFFVLLVFVLFFRPVFSQTILNSYPKELSKPISAQQVLAVYNSETRNFYTLAADKEQAILLKYNPAFFVRDSIITERPSKEYAFAAGFSFDDSQNPFVYWAAEDFGKIAAIGYDFERHVSFTKKYVFPFQEETLLGSFSENHEFILTSIADKEQKLIFYIFNNGTPTIQTLDFSSFQFTDERGKKRTLNSILENYPLEIIDSGSVSPMVIAAAKSKLYLDSKRFVLVLDHRDDYSQCFEIDLASFTIKEKKIQKPQIQKANSNSFYSNDCLFTVKANEDELMVSSTPLDSLNQKTLIHVQSDSEIEFKNSPLFSQNGNKQPAIVKQTHKFMRRLASSQVAISVYNTKDGYFITTGGVRNYANAGSILLGAVVVAASGNVDLSEDFFDPNSVQTLFFESFFDSQFQFKKREQEPFATDFLSHFLTQNPQITVNGWLALPDLFVFPYYDPKSKSIVLRKFQDGGISYPR